MIIKQLKFVDGAKQAQGVAVIIDVFRATSVIPCLFRQGVKVIYPVGTVQEAFDLKKSFPNALIIGEQGGQKVEGFDYGNSPSEFSCVDLSGKTVIHITTNGTVALVNATQPEMNFVASFVNIKATASYLKSLNPYMISIVACHSTISGETEEDASCATALEQILNEVEPNWMEIKETIMDSRSARRFLDPDITWSPLSDLEYCLDFNCCNNVIKADHDSNGRLLLNEVNVGN